MPEKQGWAQKVAPKCGAYCQGRILSGAARLARLQIVLDDSIKHGWVLCVLNCAAKDGRKKGKMWAALPPVGACVIHCQGCAVRFGEAQ